VIAAPRFWSRVLIIGFFIAACSAASGDDESLESSQASTDSLTTQLQPGETGYEEVWDLLYFQDSLGFGVADRYAEHIRTTVGVEVVVHDKAIGNLEAVRVLDRIRGNKAVDWSGLVREAEVIVFFGNPDGSGTTSDIDICISGSMATREPPVHNTEEDWMPYEAVLDDVYREIWRIRDGEPVVLRAVGFINPAISAWREAGIEEECTEALETMNRAIANAAARGGATLVSTYDLFNGMDHDEDPQPRGWIGPDGIHLSDEGEQAIADALAASGLFPDQAP
jgi:hypothetical protein